MVSDAGPAGVSKPASTGSSDPWAAAVVFVGWGDVADPGVQADGVVLVADDRQLRPEDLRVTDAVEVWPLGFDVAEQALDPGLGSRGGRNTHRDRGTF